MWDNYQNGSQYGKIHHGFDALTASGWTLLAQTFTATPPRLMAPDGCIWRGINELYSYEVVGNAMGVRRLMDVVSHALVRAVWAEHHARGAPLLLSRVPVLCPGLSRAIATIGPNPTHESEGQLL